MTIQYACKQIDERPHDHAFCVFCGDRAVAVNFLPDDCAARPGWQLQPNGVSFLIIDRLSSRPEALRP